MKSLQPFTKQVIRIIQNIPPGKVMTYGQIARLAGSPRSARQVVRILHSMSEKHNLPWHRVVNSKGEIGIKEEEFFLVQIMSLESEGVEFSKNNKIDLELYQFTPFYN
ncbi:methylated-DNA-protein-cysteine methyltransferase-like protein [Bacillus oleivorans]|uniref:Methylated-DNA-protein-cysteine methyltransferase-like protein n=1 Tax=Bacillus oleivorans TaxID=1448271 RepID=A0A285D3Z9_9BACI|nr:methylated-DNA-protein-cysteine methyltransferase-like protein [Bacillus oleivorans]